MVFTVVQILEGIEVCFLAGRRISWINLYFLVRFQAITKSK
nr:MAG TPA: hypothetical protein [Caudoviricetes sp.]